MVSHVQGSGKSYSMLYASNILCDKYNSQVFIVVDENNLEDQFASDLLNISEISYDTVVDDGGELEDVIESGEVGVFLTTIQKFGEVDHRDLSSVDTTRVVFADEAHRFLGEDLGSYMDASFKDYHYYGFTGTPTSEAIEIFSKDRDENYIHTYGMGEGVDDEAILPVNMEYREVESEFDLDGIDEDFESKAEDLDEMTRRKIIDSTTASDLERLRNRINMISSNIASHYNDNVKKK